MQCFFPLLMMLCVRYVMGDRLSNFTAEVVSASVRDVFETVLQAETMQEYLDSLNQVVEDKNDEALSRLSAELGNKLRDFLGVVERLKNKLLKNYVENSTSRDMPECCSMTNMRIDKRFQAAVDTTTACYEENSRYNKSVFTTNVNTLTEVFVDNLMRVPSLKWQYFASENGLDILFPAIKPPSCTGGNSRFRPWYIQAISNKPKRVVVLIDKSRSMATIHDGVTRMTLAKQAAQYVVSTLSPDDKFAVMAYSTTLEVFRPSRTEDICFGSRLASASPMNKRTVNSYIDQIQPEGGARYGRALSKAFELHINEHKTSNFTGEVDRVILFVSDGSPDDTASVITSTLKILGARMNNSVVIITYGIGNEDFSILQKIAVYNPDPAKRGEFVAVPDPFQLSLNMVLFHKFLYDKVQVIAKPFWSAPYIDNLSLGQVVTLSYPIVINNRTIGVVGADMRLNNLMSPSRNFKRNKFSYSFVISHTGLLYHHPFHLYSGDEEIVYEFATAFETDQEFLPIFESMKRLESGDAVISKTLFLNHDKLSDNKPVRTKYMWTNIPRTVFSCCLVVSLDHASFSLSTANSLPVGTFLYHEFDLVPPEATCAHVNLLAAQNKSALLLAFRALNISDDLKFENFTAEHIKSIGSYMEGTGPNTFKLKDAVKEDVVATYRTENLWAADDTGNNFEKQTLWRYIGTENGIFRVFPGIKLPPYFDPVTRPWYRKGFIQYNKSIITLPYVNDASSGAPIVSLARAIFKKGPETDNSHNTSANTFGVMGVDLSLRYFNDIITRFYSDLGKEGISAFILDEEGGVVLADAYLDNYLGVKHITVMEPQISSVLVREGILQRTRCSDIDRGVLLRKYTLSVSKDNLFNGSFRSSKDSCFLFVVAPVLETNAFILIKNNTGHGCQGHPQVSTTACACSSKFSSVLESCSTSWGPGDQCECPCYDRNSYFDACQSKYNHILRSAPPPCYDLSATLSNFEEDDVSNLMKCYDIFLNPQAVTHSITGAIVGIGIFGCLIIFSASMMYIYYQQKTDAKRQKAIRSVKKTYFREFTKSLGETLPAMSPSKISPTKAASTNNQTFSKKASIEPYDTNEILETFIQMSYHPRSESLGTQSKTAIDATDQDTHSSELMRYFSADTQKYLSEIESTYSKRLSRTTSSPSHADSNLPDEPYSTLDYSTASHTSPSEVDNEVMSYFT